MAVCSMMVALQGVLLLGFSLLAGQTKVDEAKGAIRAVGLAIDSHFVQGDERDETLQHLEPMWRLLGQYPTAGVKFEVPKTETKSVPEGWMDDDQEDIAEEDEPALPAKSGDEAAAASATVEVKLQRAQKRRFLVIGALILLVLILLALLRCCRLACRLRRLYSKRRRR